MSSMVQNPIIAPNTEQRKQILKNRVNSPKNDEMQRPDTYLDKFEIEMNKLCKSSIKKEKMIKNLPSRNCFLKTRE